MGVALYQGARVGGALVAALNRALGSTAEAYAEPEGVVAKMRTALGLPNAHEFLQRKAYERFAPWLQQKVVDGTLTPGDIEATERAVVATLEHFDAGEIAQLAIADRARLRTKLAEAGARHRANIGSSIGEELFDKLLDGSVRTVRTLTPGPTKEFGQALKILKEWQDEAAAATDAGFVAVVGAVQTGNAAVVDAVQAGNLAVVNAVKVGSAELAQQLADAVAQLRIDRHKLENAPQDHGALIAALSPVRMARFLDACDGDQREAMRLYHWSQSVSAQVYLSVHILEVVLRNVIDTHLRTFNHSQGNRADWTFDPCNLITRSLVVPQRDGRSYSPLEDAKRRAGRTRRGSQVAITHDDVVAHSSLRLWRNLLPTTPNRPGRFRNALWRVALHRAFPHLEASEFMLGATLDRMIVARNRAAHLEPFLSVRRLEDTYYGLIPVEGVDGV